MSKKEIKHVLYKLSVKEKTDLDKLLDNLNIKSIDFLRQSIRFFTLNPELIYKSKVIEGKNTITKEDLQEYNQGIMNALLDQQQTITEFRQLISNQKPKQDNTSLQILKQSLLSYDKVKTLNTLDKVRDYLVSQFPEMKKDINKNYYYVIKEFMLEKIIYSKSPTSKYISWRVE